MSKLKAHQPIDNHLRHCARYCRQHWMGQWFQHSRLLLKCLYYTHDLNIFYPLIGRILLKQTNQLGKRKCGELSKKTTCILNIAHIHLQIVSIYETPKLYCNPSLWSVDLQSEKYWHWYMKYTDNAKNSFYQIVSPSAPINHITKSVNRKQIAWLKFHPTPFTWSL